MASASAINDATLPKSWASVSMHLACWSLIRYRLCITVKAFFLRTGASPGGGIILNSVIFSYLVYRISYSAYLCFILCFLSHLNRKTSRILSVNRIPRRCVLVLNSALCKSSTVGLAGDLPNIDNNTPAKNPRDEPILVRADIFLVCSS